MSLQQGSAPSLESRGSRRSADCQGQRKVSIGGRQDCPMMAKSCAHLWCHSSYSTSGAFWAERTTRAVTVEAARMWAGIRCSALKRRCGEYSMLCRPAIALRNGTDLRDHAGTRPRDIGLCLSAPRGYLGRRCRLPPGSQSEPIVDRKGACRWQLCNRSE